MGEQDYSCLAPLFIHTHLQEEISMRKICSYCRERLPSLESCTCKTIRYGPESVSRIRFGDEEFLSGVDITNEEFYQKLEKDADISTSQPSPEVVMEFWREGLKEYESIVIFQ